MKLAIASLMLIFLAVTATPSGALNLLYVDGVGLGSWSDIWFHGSHDIDTWIGSFSARIDGRDLPQTYCVDLIHPMDMPSQFYVQVLTTNPLPYGSRLAWLFNHYGIHAPGAQEASATQLALWDIEYDGGDGLTTGNFQYLHNDSIASLAENLIASSVGQSSVAAFYQSPSNFGQGLLGPPIPEPASMSLLLMGGLMAALPFARKLRQQRRKE